MKLSVNEWRDEWHKRNTGLSFEEREKLSAAEQMTRGYPVKMTIPHDPLNTRLVIWGLKDKVSINVPIYLDANGVLQFVSEAPSFEQI